MVAQNEESPYGYLSVCGPAVFDELDATEEILQLGRRYLPQDEAEPYARDNFTDTGVIIRMAPDHWLGQDHTRPGD